MPDLTPIQPVAAIIGALISASIGGFVTYLIVVARKAVTFWISNSEDLTGPLKSAHPIMSFKIDDIELKNLNRGSVLVKNTGNRAISNLEFEIQVPDIHEHYLTQAVSENEKLRSSMEFATLRLKKPMIRKRHYTRRFLSSTKKSRLR